LRFPRSRKRRCGTLSNVARSPSVCTGDYIILSTAKSLLPAAVQHWRGWWIGFCGGELASSAYGIAPTRTRTIRL
jgi:hypothetical protein